MNIIEVTELVLVALVLWAIWAQIITPMWNNTQYFPIFRRRRKLEAELRQAREEVENEALRQEINETKPAKPNQPTQ